jgi:preprotein translocase subunit SecD
MKKSTIVFSIILIFCSVFIILFGDNFSVENKKDKQNVKLNFKERKKYISEGCKIKKLNKFDGFYELDTKGIEFKTVFDSSSIYKLHEKPFINSSSIHHIFIKKHKNDSLIELDITLDSENVEKYAKLTENNIGKMIFFVIDGFILANPTVNCKIENGTFYLSIERKLFQKLFKVIN